ncbi:MAG: BamA/TamA family outer membrane protein [Bacteroidales bacterium]
MTRLQPFFLAGILLLMGHAVRAQNPLVIADDKLLVDSIRIEGNRVTRESIILRELVFGVGDTIAKMELLPAFQRSKENLLNLSLFNFVFFDATHAPGNRITVIITVTERWYIWPMPILEYAERNFSTFIQNREWHKINYGAWIKWSNFRGRNDELTAKIRLGYVQEYALAYSMPNMGKRQIHGLSAGFNMKQQNEATVFTVNNRPEEFRPIEKPAMIRLNAHMRYSFRPKLYTTHFLKLEYYHFRVSDSVAIVNPNYLGEDKTQLGYFTVSYNFQYDARDSRIYPLEGVAVRLRAEQVGLGIEKDFPYPGIRLTGVFMLHQELARRIYFYNATKAQYSSVKILPYIMNKGLGYNEFLSGYEPYVIDGSDYFITKYSLKLLVVKPKVHKIPFIPLEQFNKVHYSIYLNAFVDAGYVNNIFASPTNTLVNNWQFSTGVGLDFVTYYDQVLRIDYALNRFGEHGFFFHIEVPFLRW